MATWMRRLKLRHLEVLVAVSDAGSLTAAAALLGASQPSVSQWLADSESALGVRLYERGRQLRPTPFLEPVLWHARRMLNDSQRLQAELEAIRSGSAGIVRIGLLHVAGPHLVPEAVLRIKAESALTQVELVEDIAAGLWPRFERRELDLLVTRLDARAHSPGTRCETLYADLHVVIAGVRHPLLRRRPPTWQQAAAFPWILPPSGTALRHSIDATFVEQGLPPPSAWLESVAMTANQALLERTSCLAVVSGGLAQHLKRMAAIGILPLRLTTDLGPVGMVWHERKPARSVQIALDALRQVAKKISAR